jgi:hypothetical protein
MSGKTPATRGWLHRPTHAFGRCAVALVSVALVGVVAVTTAWTSARTAAPVHLYWANNTPGWGARPSATTIGRARLDGRGVEHSFVSGAGRRPCGVALDRKHIYWGELQGGEVGSRDEGGAIGRANRDGSGVNARFIPPPDGGGCGVAIAGSHIYWTSWACKIVPGRGCWWAPSSPAAIVRANVDGTGVDDQFITGLAIPRSPAFQTAGPCGIAVAGKYIYWMNSAESGKPVPIGRANLDGTGVNKRFITGVTNGFCGIAVVGGHIYWTTGGFVGRANLDGTGSTGASSAPRADHAVSPSTRVTSTGGSPRAARRTRSRRSDVPTSTAPPSIITSSPASTTHVAASPSDSWSPIASTRLVRKLSAERADSVITESTPARNLATHRA